MERNENGEEWTVHWEEIETTYVKKQINCKSKEEAEVHLESLKKSVKPKRNEAYIATTREIKK